ncbi:MAG TPA: hypothetical protein VMR02_15140 [Terracidiphilus sp.]|nr:hypothetical protein [Terracidiphilus sp.]
MTTKALAGMEELVLRVQAELTLATKAQAQNLVNIFVSCTIAFCVPAFLSSPS